MTHAAHEASPDQHAPHDHHASHHHHGHHDDSGLAELLDLDAEVLREYHREVITWVASQVTGQPRIIDLGAGTGAGTLALAQYLMQAEVTAVDIDEDMLGRIRHQAAALGVSERVHTVQAD